MQSVTFIKKKTEIYVPFGSSTECNQGGCGAQLLEGADKIPPVNFQDGLGGGVKGTSKEVMGVAGNYGGYYGCVG